MSEASVAVETKPNTPETSNASNKNKKKRAFTNPDDLTLDQGIDDLNRLMQSDIVSTFVSGKPAAESKVAENPATIAKPQPSGEISGSKQLSTTESLEAGELYPWMDNAQGLSTLSVRIPVDLKEIVTYLGDTTRGESITSITARGLRNEIIRMANKKGLPIPKEWVTE